MLESKKGNSGFTLIEVLIVLVIISILMTIAFIFLGDQGKRARLATAASSVKSAMTIASTCQILGGIVQDPPDNGDQGPGTAICTGVASLPATSVWPKLPDKCYYCWKGNTEPKNIRYRCDGSCDENTDSYCNYDNTQCVQKN